MVPLETLKKLRFLHGLPEGHLRQIASVAEETSYDPGHVIFREGQVCHSIFIVAEGNVSLSLNVPGHGPAVFQTVGPGELLGWTPILSEGPMTATARATNGAEVVAINAAQILAFSHRDPSLGHEILRRTAQTLSERLAATRLQMLDVFRAHPPAVPAFSEQGGHA